MGAERGGLYEKKTTLKISFIALPFHIVDWGKGKVR